jgi:hypothetical protein
MAIRYRGYFFKVAGGDVLVDMACCVVCTCDVDGGKKVWAVIGFGRRVWIGDRWVFSRLLVVGEDFECMRLEQRAKFFSPRHKRLMFEN